MMERATFGSNYASSDFDFEVPAPPGLHPPGLQRQMSRSEPHLNLPRFHIGQTAGDGDEALSRAMSGLFAQDSNYHMPGSTPLDRSTNDLSEAGDTFNQPPSSSGAFLTIGDQPLRKSASAVDHRSLFPPAANAPFTSSTSDSNAMVGGQQSDTLMRVSSWVGFTPANSPSMTPKNQQASHTQTSTLVDQAAALGPALRPNTGSFGGFFGRGFFAKPVMGNQEEHYRYLMALDR